MLKATLEPVKDNSNIIKSDVGFFFDFVKAAGIIGIYCFHFYGRFLAGYKVEDAVASGLLAKFLITAKTFSQYISTLFQALFAFGNIGVELFIISSGFGLYFSYLLRKGSWRSFYWKRFLRILPLYYFFLILIFLLTVFVSNQKLYASPEGLKVLVYHLFLVQTFNNSYTYYGFFYFISIIFQLYMIFPLLINIVRNDTVRLPFFILSVFFSYFINRLFVILGIHFSGILLTDYLPLFLFGMLIADSIYFKRKMHTFIFNKLLTGFCILLLIAVVIYLVLFRINNQGVVKMFFAILVFIELPVVFGIVKHLKTRPLISVIAYSSYTFYLMHMIFINRGLQLFAHYGLTDTRLNWLFIGIIILPITMFFAYLVQRGYDRITGRFSKGMIVGTQ
jgi:peptidoglycan/LPS O-acetylase OafA/YrhL